MSGVCERLDADVADEHGDTTSPAWSGLQRSVWNSSGRRRGPR